MNRATEQVGLYYEDIHSWMNELQFMEDEQNFLEHLLSQHFLELSSATLYSNTRKIIRKLQETKIFGTNLIDQVHLHNKQLATLMTREDPTISEAIENQHESLQKDLDFHVVKVKYLKKKLFSIIKDILKQHKKKLLLS